MQPIELLMTVPIDPLVVEALEARFVVHRLWAQDDPDALLTQVGRRVRALVTSTSFGAIDAPLLDRLRQLEIIASFGVGYEQIDTAACGQRGIVVTNTPGVLEEEVADLAIGLTLATLRRIPQADRFVRAGLWPAGGFPPSPSLRGRRVGIVGLGRIGRAVARRLSGFGVPIAYHGRTRRDDVDLPYHRDVRDLAGASDLLIVTVSGGPETRHLIDAAVLKALGADGVLINVSRGSVVDQAALTEALRSGTILAAGLDVYETEPEVPDELRALDTVVLLPHVGSRSVHSRRAAGQLLVDNLVSWFSGSGALTPVPETPRPRGADEPGS